MSLFLFSMILLKGSSPAPVDPHRLALELSSADWFKWVTWYGYAVAFGCFMEVWEVSITMKAWWLQKFCKKEVEEDKKSWAIPLAAIGLIIIVAGIVLETYSEGRAAEAETELRNHFSDQLSIAETAAGAAQILASNNEEEAAQLRKDAAELEDSISWRKIPLPKRTSLAASLKPYGGQVAWLTYNMNDIEANDFGEEIADVLEAAHWVPTEPEALMKMFEGPVNPGTNRPPRGVIIQSNPASEKAAKALSKELMAAGFDTTLGPTVPLGHVPGQALGVDVTSASAGNFALNRPLVYISIEPRPNGPQGDAKLRAIAKKRQQISAQVAKH